MPSATNKPDDRNLTRLLLSIGLLGVALPGPALADTFEWTTGVNGNFNDASKWTNTTGVDPAPPNAGDTVSLNDPGFYSITLTQNEAADRLTATSGDVVLRSNTGTLRTLTLATGAADASVNGGLLTVGSFANPVFLNLPNVTSGGGMSSSVLIVGSGSDGILTVDGPASRLDALGDATHLFGVSGGFGGLTLLNGATANIATQGGMIDLGVSGNANSQGDISVIGASTLNTGNLQLATTSSGATGTISVIGNGSVLEQTLAGANLTVGSPSGGTGTINISGTGAFINNTGTTTIDATGSINVTGTLSSFRTAGPVNILSGGTLSIDDGAFVNAFAGLDNSAGGALNLQDGVLTITGGAFVPNSGGNFTVSSDLDLTLGAGVTSDITGIFGIGDSASATVSIIDGAQVTSTAGLVRGGSFPSPLQPIATLAVDGAGSQWTVNGPINVGSFESQFSATAGRLQVTEGAVVASDSGTLGITASSPIASDPNTPAIALVSGAGSRWTISGALVGGIRQLSIMEVSDQAVVETATAELGQPTRLVIDGPDSRLNVSGLLVANAQESAAVDSAGNLVNTGVKVRNGGALTAGEAVLNFFFPDPDSPTGVSNALTSPEFGVIRVSDPGSLFSVSGLLRLGSNGILPGDANLHVSNGGRLETGSAWVGGVGASPAVTDDSEFRRVTVSDPGSEWHNTGDLALGGDFVAAAGLGEVILENEGQLVIGGALTVWEEGRITLNGGALKLDSSLATNDGTVAFNSGKLILTDAAGYTVGSGEAFVEDLLGDTAVVLSPGRSLQVENTLTALAGASITQVDGSLDANTLNNNGLVNANGTTITTSAGFNNDGQLVLIDATIDGPLDNGADATVTVIGAVDFNGAVTGSGEFFGPGVANFNGALSLGASPAEVAFEGSVALNETSELLVELGGAAIGEFDRLVVGGDLSLGGDLRVELLDGFAPELGDSFEILTAAGGVAGEFFQENFPTLSSGGFEVIYEADSISLLVVSALAGDYNNDGTVDAADYTVWRDNEGQPAGTLVNDTDGGVIGAAQYSTWVANFGATLPGTSPAVPEPASLMGLGIAASCLLVLRARAG